MTNADDGIMTEQFKQAARHLKATEQAQNEDQAALSGELLDKRTGQNGQGFLAGNTR